jgi:hypothetical protein
MTLHDSPTKTIPPEHLRSFGHQVYRARKELCTKQLKGFEIDDTYGTLDQYAERFLWSDLVNQHNDPTNDYHINLFEFCVIGHQTDLAEHDVFRLNLSSLWMLLHVFRAIRAGWVFQLNGDVTGKVCRRSVDLLSLSVTSIPKRTNTLCLCIIPHTTESEQAFTVVYNELRKAVCLVPSINTCDDASCQSCSIIRELLADAEVRKYIETQKFKDCILPVDTAMCDNFVGWGNFAENILGVIANICHTHATGNVHDFPCLD